MFLCFILDGYFLILFLWFFWRNRTTIAVCDNLNEACCVALQPHYCGQSETLNSTWSIFFEKKVLVFVLFIVLSLWLLFDVWSWRDAWAIVCVVLKSRRLSFDWFLALLCCSLWMFVKFVQLKSWASKDLLVMDKELVLFC